MMEESKSLRPSHCPSSISTSMHSCSASIVSEVDTCDDDVDSHDVEDICSMKDDIDVDIYNNSQTRVRSMMIKMNDELLFDYFLLERKKMTRSMDEKEESDGKDHECHDVIDSGCCGDDGRTSFLPFKESEVFELRDYVVISSSSSTLPLFKCIKEKQELLYRTGTVSIKPTRDAEVSQSKALFHCQICEEVLILDEKSNILCQNEICKICLRRWAIAYITSHRFDIPCPFDKCKDHFITEQEIQLNAPDVIPMIRSEEFKYLGHNKKKCTDCQQQLIVPVKMVKARAYDVLQCPNEQCKKNKSLICFYCAETITYANFRLGLHSCGKQDEAAAVKGSRKRKEMKFTRHCPNCYMVIVKNGGCSHMVCATCQTRFCWDCLGTQEHLEFGGSCPGTVPPSRIKQFLDSQAAKTIVDATIVVTTGPILLTTALIAAPFVLTWTAGQKAYKYSSKQIERIKFRKFHSFIDGRIWWFPLRLSYEYSSTTNQNDPLINQWVSQSKGAADRIDYFQYGVNNVKISINLHPPQYLGGIQVLELPDEIFPLFSQSKEWRLPNVLQDWEEKKKLSLQSYLDVLAIIFQECLYFAYSFSLGAYSDDIRFSEPKSSDVINLARLKFSNVASSHLAELITTFEGDLSSQVIIESTFRYHVRKVVQKN